MIFTALALILAAPISSETHRTGDTITATAPDGATVTGRVVQVQKPRNRGRDGSITVWFDAPCNTAHTITGRTGTLGNIAAIGVGGLFIKGKHAVAPVGTNIACETE